MGDAFEVDVWTAAAAPAAALVHLLDDAERVYASALRGRQQRDRYVTAHAMLRSVLAERTGVDPARVRIARRPCARCSAPHGKPFLSGQPSTTFSLSHSGDITVAAVAIDHEVGVDVEDLAKMRNIQALATKTLSDAERGYFESSGADAECFLRLWTRKEAVLKASGLGITRRLSTVDIPPTAATAEYEGTWSLVELDLPAGFVGTLAAAGTGARVRRRQWPD
jgi:4'-phosphopantetheinyl transferase